MKTNVEQIQLLGKAIKTLIEVIKFIESKEFDVSYITYLNDSSTQRFEYTFELYWKTLKLILESQ
jgi:hypothetical protein